MDKFELLQAVATRQFRHNDDNSPDMFEPVGGFVIAYDKEVIDKGLKELRAQLDASIEITMGHVELAASQQATNEALTHELGKTIKAADKLEQGIQKFLDGDEPKQLSSKFSGCIHRDLNHQDCARCINDYFSGLLNGARDDNS